MFGLPKLYAYGAAAVIAALFMGGIYLKGRSDGKAVVQAVLDAQRATWIAAYEKQKAETDRIQDEWNKAKEIERELQERLGVVSSDAADIARRLRLATRQCRRPLPEAPAPAGDAGSPGGESPDLGSLEESHFSACARDAERLTKLQEWYDSLRQAQNTP